MVNVDGVIYGNFRCDATGMDLNRRWKEPSKLFHPQIWELKRKIAGLHKDWKVDLCLDLHGHSKKYNVFCYACKTNSFTCRILPYMIQA
jgi:murein tripeptide amidase MpaA